MEELTENLCLSQKIIAHKTLYAITYMYLKRPQNANNQIMFQLFWKRQFLLNGRIRCYLISYVISAKSSTLCTLTFNLSPLVSHRSSMRGGVASLYTVTDSSRYFPRTSIARTVTSSLLPSDHGKLSWFPWAEMELTEVKSWESTMPDVSSTVYATWKSTHAKNKCLSLSLQ